MPSLLGPIAVVAAIAILSAEAGWRRIFYVAKPGATLLILVQAALPGAMPPGSPRVALLAALFLSLVGDILLVLPRDSFRQGLAAFLLAHVAFIAALATRLASPPPIGPLAVLLGLVGLLLFSLRRNLGDVALPVLSYAIVISLMVWAAWGGWLAQRSQVTGMAFGGALLFLLSDTILALRRFRHAFLGSQTLALAPYYSALLLISLSFTR